jgi:hypothetical protein
MLGEAIEVLCVVGKKRMYSIYIKNTRSGVIGLRLVCSKKLEETNEFDSWMKLGVKRVHRIVGWEIAVSR